MTLHVFCVIDYKRDDSCGVIKYESIMWFSTSQAMLSGYNPEFFDMLLQVLVPLNANCMQKDKCIETDRKTFMPQLGKHMLLLSQLISMVSTVLGDVRHDIWPVMSIPNSPLDISKQ